MALVKANLLAEACLACRYAGDWLAGVGPSGQLACSLRLVSLLGSV